VKDVISKAIDFIAPTLNGIAQLFKDVFGGTTAYAKSLTDYADTLGSSNSTFSTTTSFVDKLRGAFENLHGWVDKVKTIIGNLAKTIKNILSPVFESIKKKLDEVSLQDIGAILTGSGFLMLARTISKGVTSFSKVLNELGNALKAFQLKVKAEALLKIAIALAILAGALIALSFIDLEDLAKSLATLTVVFAELVGGLIIINKYVKDIKKVTTQMVALGIGMLLLAFAVKTLSSIDTGKLIQGVAALGALLGLLTAFTKLTKGGDLKASARGLAGFAIGILILTASLAILGKIKTRNLVQGVSALAALMTIIALFINLTKEGDLKKSAGGLMAFSIGILILSGALAILGNLKMENLIQGTVAIATLMTIIALFINLTKQGDLKGSAAGLMGFATGILILTASLAILGNLDTGKLIQGAVAITTLMTVIALFINMTKEGDLRASAGGLIGFSIGILILTASLAILGKLDTGKLIQGTLAIAALMTAIGAFITLTKEGDLKGSAKGLIGFAIGLIILSEAVAILAAIDSKKIIQGMAALVALMTAIAVFITVTKEGDLKKSASGLIGFSTGLMILAGVIAILSALNPQKLIMASGAIVALILAIGVFINLTKEGDLKASSLGLTVFAVAIAILVAALIPLARLNLGQIIAAGGAITVLLLAIAAFTKLTKASDLILSAAGLAVFSGEF
jgi:hypothetical protein